jgi:xanthine/uracil/vitamin C permease (AzgA family)
VCSCFFVLPLGHTYVYIRSSAAHYLVVDLDELRTVHGLWYLIRVRAAPAAAMVPAVAAAPPAVRVAAAAAAAVTRVAAAAVPVLDLHLLLLFGRLCHNDPTRA